MFIPGRILNCSMMYRTIRQSIMSTIMVLMIEACSSRPGLWSWQIMQVVNKQWLDQIFSYNQKLDSEVYTCSMWEGVSASGFHSVVKHT